MCTNPVYAYNLFYVKLMERYDKCLPTVSVTENYISTKKPWITKGILKCRKVKNKLYRKFLSTPSEINEKIYKRYRNQFNKIKATAKKIYYHQKFEEAKGNIKSNWKLINEVIHKTKSNIDY